MASTDDELQKASKLITKGELKKAQIILENLSKENLSKEVSLRVFNNLALIYNSWNDVEESSKYYTKILELHSDDNWYNINSNQKLLSLPSQCPLIANKLKMFITFITFNFRVSVCQKHSTSSSAK